MILYHELKRRRALASGNLRGARFAAIYEVGTRSGKLVLRKA
jgi:hypothetical protein